jgi:hypothetical protein
MIYGIPVLVVAVRVEATSGSGRVAIAYWRPLLHLVPRTPVPSGRRVAQLGALQRHPVVVLPVVPALDCLDKVVRQLGSFRLFLVLYGASKGGGGRGGEGGGQDEASARDAGAFRWADGRTEEVMGKE